MTWFKLDDQFHSQPKVIAAGNAAIGLYCRLGTYCADKLTDGFVPTSVAHHMGTKREINALTACPIPDTRSLLSVVDAGYLIRDYLEFNPPRDKVLADREAAKDRMHKRRGTPVRSHEHPSNVRTNTTPNLNGSSRPPVPVPLNTGCTESSRRLTAVPPTSDDDDLEAVLAIITNARIEGRTGVRNPRAYRNTVLAEARAQDGELARSLLADGSPLEQVALFVLGHGLGAEAEHHETPTGWCDEYCERCGGDQWIWMGEDDRPHPCPNGPRAKKADAP